MPFASINVPLSLANLPHDIIRRIILMEEHALDSMRLISPPWNALVKQYLFDPDQLIPLERAYILADDSTPVRMYAIMPEDYATRIGYGRWLNLYQRFNDGSVEIRSCPRNIAHTDGHLPWYKLVLISLCCLVPSGLIGVYFSKVAATILIIITLLITGCCLCENSRFEAREKRIQARFTRFFAYFSRIETLTLSNLWSTEIYEAVRSTLGDIPINRLDCRMTYFGAGTRKQIVKLCKRHGIRHVSIITDAGSHAEMSKFIYELSNTDVILDVYESLRLTINPLLGQPRAFWDDMATRLAAKDIAMTTTSVDDGLSARGTLPAGTKSHIQIAPADFEYPEMNLRGFGCI